MKLKQKLPDLKNAFGVLELYATDPEKQRELEESLRSDENFAFEMAARYEPGVADGNEKGIEQGIVKGIKKGEFQKAIETARKLPERGFSREEIIEITGLTLEDLEKHGMG